MERYSAQEMAHEEINDKECEIIAVENDIENLEELSHNIDREFTSTGKEILSESVRLELYAIKLDALNAIQTLRNAQDAKIAVIKAEIKQIHDQAWPNPIDTDKELPF